MAQFKGVYIPPWKAAVNVAWETVRSQLPERSRLVRRAQTEMSTMPGQGYGTENHGVAEDGFAGQEDGYANMDHARESYQQSRGATMSVATSGGSFDEFGGGEGKSRHKINEWQAAWNVTNAIQGMFIVNLPFAVLTGGYWAILAMFGIAYICCYKV